LDQILAKMLAREPRDRYQTASELIVDLERAELGAAVPSFIDPDRALQDPLVRQRLTAPAQPTIAEMNVPDNDRADGGAADPELWYLRYRDRHGRWCKAKATVTQIVERLKGGKLGPDSEASRAPQGEFQPLDHFEPFKQAVLDGAVATKARAGKKKRKAAREPLPTPPVRVGDSAVLAPPRNWLILGMAMSLAVLVVIVIVCLILRPS